MVRRSGPAVFDVVGYVVLGAVLLLVTRNSWRPLGNPDTWFHLRIGQELLGPWKVSDPGTLSAFATADWVPTQWSAQMLAAAIFDQFGLPGVAWLFGIVQLAAVAAVYVLCRSRSAPLVAALVTVLAVLASTPSFSARPQIVSVVFLAVTVGAWMKSLDDRRPRWWLVPMTWIWATAHGFWSVGVLVGFVACIGLVLDHRPVRRDVLVPFAVPVLSLLAACLTPVGPALVGTQLAVSARSSMIGEWGPTSFRQAPALLVALMLAVLIVVWVRGGRVRWSEILFMLLAAALAAYAVRMVALGALVAAPLLASALQNLIGRTRPPPTRRGLAGLAATLAGCGILLALVAPHTAAKPTDVPVDLSGRLAALPAGSAVMVDGTVGSWIEWRFPGLNPVIDGMFDAYTLEYMRKYASAIALEPGWQQFVDGSGAQVAVLAKDGPVATAMVERLGWRRDRTDGAWVLLEAPD